MQTRFNAISLTPELGVVHKVEELGSRVAKEAEIIHEEEDGNEDEKGGGGTMTSGNRVWRERTRSEM